MTQDPQLTEAEQAVYDRQLRVWGVEVQKRLNEGRLLIVGCNGLAAEVAKNIVLAGVGSISLLDDTPCSARSPANFLVFDDSPQDTSVASAAANTLQEMNPLVKVQSVPGPLTTATLATVLPQYAAILLVNPSASLAESVDQHCSSTGGTIKLYCAWNRGTISWFWVNLGHHHYTSTDKSASQKGKQELACIDLKTALATPYSKLNIRRTHKFWFLLQVMWEFEQQHSRRPDLQDAAALREALAARAAQAGITGDKVLSEALLQQYLQGTVEVPAVNAVLGGLLANELVKAIGGKGEPFVNFVFYCLEDGNAVIEKMTGP